MAARRTLAILQQFSRTVVPRAANHDFPATGTSRVGGAGMYISFIHVVKAGIERDLPRAVQGPGGVPPCREV